MIVQWRVPYFCTSFIMSRSSFSVHLHTGLRSLRDDDDDVVVEAAVLLLPLRCDCGGSSCGSCSCNGLSLRGASSGGATGDEPEPAAAGWTIVLLRRALFRNAVYLPLAR